MSLSISVGILADLLVNDPEGAEWVRSDFAIINDLLHRRGLPRHEEPASLPRLDDRSGLVGCPYSYLHHLRRFYARRIHRPDQVPPPGVHGEKPAHDPILNEVSSPKHHLLWHSDCEGYYLPIDFPEVLEGEGITSAGVGSSVRLLEELILISRPLGILLRDGHLSDGDASTISNEDDAIPYSIERQTWLALYEAVRLSIGHRTAIHFG